MPFILLLVFVLCPCLASAEGPHSALDSSPSVDAAAVPMSTLQKPGQDASQFPSEVPPAVAPEAQANYVYDLKKLIIKSRENIQRVNAKIKEQAVIQRNQKREERAREYYEHGLQLNEEGKFAQAREYFEKAINITEHPEMAKYIQQSVTKLKAQEAALKREGKQQVHAQVLEQHSRIQEAQTAYEEAVRLYREKKFKEAKDQFAHVEELSADYKGTRSYLHIIDQEIIQTEALSQKEQSKAIERQQAESEKAREREKEAWKKEIDRKEKDRLLQVNQQAGNVYNEAVDLYKQKKFIDAKKKFQEVELVTPDYKATRNYLGRVDKDVEQEQKKIEAENAKALAKQQWEEEVARHKKEAEEKRKAAEDEKQRIKQLEDQVSLLYQGAVGLFDQKKYDDAYEKFKDIEKTLPSYKSTRVFLAKIEHMRDQVRRAQVEKAAAEAKRKAQEEEKLRQDKIKQEEKIRQEEASRQRTKAMEEERARQEEASRHRAKAMEEERARAAKVRQETKLLAPKAAAPRNIIVPAPRPMPSKPAANTKEDQLKEAQEIVELSAKSSMLYKKIANLAEDKRISPVKRKAAQVDEALNRLKVQKEALIRQMRAEEERNRLRMAEEVRQQVLVKAEATYDEAIMLLRDQKFDEAKVRFAELEFNVPNYKSTRNYLGHIEEDRQEAERQAVLERTNAEEKRLKDIQVKARIEEEARRAAEKERRRKLKAAQEMEVQNLADKASLLNDDILILTNQRDFEAAKSKFVELEGVLSSLQTIKQALAIEQVPEVKAQPPAKIPEKIDITKNIKKKDQRERLFREKADKALKEKNIKDRALIKKEVQLLRHAPAKDRVPPQIRKALSEARRRDAREFKEYMQDRKTVRNEPMPVAPVQAAPDVPVDPVIVSAPVVPAKIEPVKASTIDPVQAAKDAELLKQKQAAYNKARDLYFAGRYGDAKVIFDELSAQNYPGVGRYLRKLARVQEDQEAQAAARKERERAIFIAQQVKRQRMAKVLDEKDRIHHRELSLAIEKQRRLADEERRRDRVRLESLSLKERERQRVEEEEKNTADGRHRAEEKYQFRKIAPMTPKQEIKPEDNAEPFVNVVKKIKDDETPAPAVVPPAPAVVAPVVAPAAELSVAAPAAVPVISDKERKAQIEYSDKRKEALKREYLKKEHEKEISAKKEEMSAKKEEVEKQRVQAEKQAQEAKIARQRAIEEQKLKVQSQREARERQKKLEIERQAIQKKMVRETENMYQSALRMYRSGDFNAAASRFQDIEDIIPGYKQTRDFIRRSRLNSSRVAEIPAYVPTSDPVSSTAPTAYPAATTPPATSDISKEFSVRDEAISKTLDVFDSNAR